MCVCVSFSLLLLLLTLKDPGFLKGLSLPGHRRLCFCLPRVHHHHLHGYIKDDYIFPTSAHLYVLHAYDAFPSLFPSPCPVFSLSCIAHLFALFAHFLSHFHAGDPLFPPPSSCGFTGFILRVLDERSITSSLIVNIY